MNLIKLHENFKDKFPILYTLFSKIIVVLLALPFILVLWFLIAIVVIYFLITYVLDFSFLEI